MAVEISRFGDGITATVRGLPDLKAALLAIPQAFRLRVLRTALREGAKIVQRAARAKTPTLRTPNPYRTKGLLKRKISIRQSKHARQRGNVGVFVNVKPAPGAKFKLGSGIFGSGIGRKRTMFKASQRGAKSKLDPFYWRFINWGWRPHGKGAKQGGKQFLEEGAKALPAALDRIETYIEGTVRQMNERNAVILAGLKR